MRGRDLVVQKILQVGDQFAAFGGQWQGSSDWIGHSEQIAGWLKRTHSEDEV